MTNCGVFLLIAVLTLSICNSSGKLTQSDEIKDVLASIQSLQDNLVPENQQANPEYIKIVLETITKPLFGLAAIADSVIGSVGNNLVRPAKVHIEEVLKNAVELIQVALNINKNKNPELLKELQNKLESVKKELLAATADSKKEVNALQAKSYRRMDNSLSGFIQEHNLGLLQLFDDYMSKIADMPNALQGYIDGQCENDGQKNSPDENNSAKDKLLAGKKEELIYI